MEKAIELTENIRHQMLGLLPFDLASREEFVPNEFLITNKESGELVFPEKFHPVFILSPWSKSDHEKVVLLMGKLQDEKNYGKKRALNIEVNSIVQKYVRDIKNLYDLGKKEFVSCSTENDYITDDIWFIIPEKIKTAIYFRLLVISGMATNEVLGL